MNISNEIKIKVLKDELDQIGHVLRDIQTDVCITRQDKEFATEDGELDEAESCERSIIRSMKLYASYRNEELDLMRRILSLGGTIS